jgi:hypothetical protein
VCIDSYCIALTLLRCQTIEHEAATSERILIGSMSRGRPAGSLCRYQLRKHQTLLRLEDSKACNSRAESHASGCASQTGVQQKVTEESSRILSDLSSPQQGPLSISAASHSDSFSPSEAESGSQSFASRHRHEHEDCSQSAVYEEEDEDGAYLCGGDYEGALMGEHTDHGGGTSEVSDADSELGAMTREEVVLNWRRQKSQLPAGLSERDKFLLRARARAVFTMQAWRAQTAELMKMDTQSIDLAT